MSEVRYERPESVGAACALLAEAGDRAAVLAGGTDLLVKLRAGALGRELLVDIKAIPGLGELCWRPDGELVLGAAVTMRQLCDDEDVREVYPALADGARGVGSLQIRERATVGGNLCNASPCMDTAPPLLVLDARVVVASTSGERELPLASFFTGPKQTRLGQGELVTAIRVPASSKPRRSAFAKLKRVRGHDLALVNAAVSYDVQSHALLAAVGSCGPTPVLLPALLVPRGGDPARAAAGLAELALAHIRPIDDVRASAEYRREMTALLCRRLAAAVLSEGGRA